MSDVRLIKRIIEEHFAEIHSIKDIARFTESSPESIRKEFFRAEHITLGVFIRTKKAEEAKRLLLRTNNTCKSVAQAIGCSRLDVASRMFQRLIGQTMTDFRKAVRKK